MFTMVDVLDLEIGTASSSLKHLLRLICDGGITLVGFTVGFILI